MARAEPITHAPHRARLPLEIYPISAGVKGGLAGSVVMAGLACHLWGDQSPHHLVSDQPLGRWFFPSLETTTELDAFHGEALVIATILHLATSLLVGLLYGAMLPMLPRRPILLGGAIAPLLWTGLLYSVLQFINPVMNRRIDWPWFVVSQIGFGVVAGFVVSRQERVRTWQHLPFAVRAGIEVPRGEDETHEEQAAMKRRTILHLAVLASLGGAACDSSPGRPRPDQVVLAPERRVGSRESCMRKTARGATAQMATAALDTARQLRLPRGRR